RTPPTRTPGRRPTHTGGGRTPPVFAPETGAGAVLPARVGGFLLASRRGDRQQQALATARAELAATPAHHLSPSTQAFRQAVLSQREQRSLALASAIGKRVAWDRILRRFALVLPSDIWLISLDGNVPLDSGSTATATTPGALPTTPTALTIVGYTYSQASVARLLERLQVLPDLKNVTLTNSGVTLLGGQNVMQFTISSDIRQGRGAS